MAAVRIEKLLKRYLDELNDETLREFQWQASLDGEIPRCKLQDVTREDTVDRLVQFQGEEKAALTTINIFLDMNQNNLAQKLLQVISDRNTELEKQPVVSTVRLNQRDDFPIGPHDLSCTICLLLFNDPVVLQCGHSFCKTCMHQEWSGKETRKCPLCQKVLPKTEPAINYNLRGLCESYREKNPAEPCQTPPTSIREKQGVSEKGKQFSDTNVAHMKIPLKRLMQYQEVEKEVENIEEFYETTVADMEVRPMYTITKKKRNVFENVQQFSNHSVEHVKTQPLSKSIRERPEAFEKWQKSSDPFVERIEVCQHMLRTVCQSSFLTKTSSYCNPQKQACDAEKKIKDEFVQLHRLLRTIEKARLNALERDKRNKVCLLKKVAELSRGLASLTDTLENSKDMGPDGEFTENTRTLLERAHRELTDPQNHEPSQINVSEHVENLRSRICRELLDTVEES